MRVERRTMQEVGRGDQEAIGLNGDVCARLGEFVCEVAEPIALLLADEAHPRDSRRRDGLCCDHGHRWDQVRDVGHVNFDAAQGRIPPAHDDRVIGTHRCGTAHFNQDVNETSIALQRIGTQTAYTDSSPSHSRSRERVARRRCIRFDSISRSEIATFADMDATVAELNVVGTEDCHHGTCDFHVGTRHQRSRESEP